MDADLAARLPLRGKVERVKDLGKLLGNGVQCREIDSV